MHKDWLIKIEQYLKKDKSLREIAVLLSTNHRRISNICKKNNIHIPTEEEKNLKYIGKKFNNLTIVRVYCEKDNRKITRKQADCLCDCGNIKKSRLESVIKSKVKSCGCASKNRLFMSGSNNPAFKGYGEIRASYILEIKRSAKRRKLEYNLTKKYLWNLFISQNKKCALTGEDIYFGRIGHLGERTASLDRIDSSKGYIEGNVQWLHKNINRIKQTFSQESFINICYSVVKYQDSLKEISK